jgi:hyaluronan synthase
MYLRWDRSYVREEIRFARIVWKRPLVPMLIAAVDKLITNLRFPVAWSVTVMVALVAMADPTALLRVLLVIGIGAGFYMLYYAYMERSMRFVHGIIYSYFSFFALWWILPYAILTVRSRSWMTR